MWVGWWVGVWAAAPVGLYNRKAPIAALRFLLNPGPPLLTVFVRLQGQAVLGPLSCWPVCVG